MMVNGTEDVALEWEAISWRLHEDNVRRLRRRIFKAAKELHPQSDHQAAHPRQRAGKPDETRLVHTDCQHRASTGSGGTEPASSPT